MAETEGPRQPPVTIEVKRGEHGESLWTQLKPDGTKETVTYWHRRCIYTKEVRTALKGLLTKETDKKVQLGRLLTALNARIETLTEHK